jgi:hypothetical protein
MAMPSGAESRVVTACWVEARGQKVLARPEGQALRVWQSASRAHYCILMGICQQLFSFGGTSASPSPPVVAGCQEPSVDPSRAAGAVNHLFIVKM